MLDIPWCRYARHINATYFLVVFFLVSGYLFAHSRPKPFIETLGDKVRRLLVPYLSFELINTFFKLEREIIRNAITNWRNDSGWYLRPLIILLRTVVPICILLIFLSGLGLL